MADKRTHAQGQDYYLSALARSLYELDSNPTSNEWMLLAKAIEAASLLHDMGTLAVPEQIHNKPGKLTAAELCRSSGYENWNGSGYPNALSGDEILFGAMILAVVDCFDALTSDRPYRPRVTLDHTLDTQRAPRIDVRSLVVDMFIELHPNWPQVQESDLAAINCSSLSIGLSIPGTSI